MTAVITTHEQLIKELARERYAPVLPPPARHQPRARQALEPAQPERRPTGTGWPA